MKFLLLLACLLQEPVIVFPSETIRADTPKPPAEIDKFTTEEWYLIQSPVPLDVFDSPAGIVTIEEVPTGTRLRGKFAGQSGIQTLVAESPFLYVLEGQATGRVEIMYRPEGSKGRQSLRRRLLDVIDVPKPDPITPGPVEPKDDVAKAFRVYEREWRLAQKELATRLENKVISSEEEAADWFKAAHRQCQVKAFTSLLTAEELEFGGEQWTPEKHALYIRRYFSAE